MPSPSGPPAREVPLSILLLVHALVGLVVLAVGRRLGRRALAAAALAPAATVAWLLVRVGGVLDGRAVTEHRAWVGDLGLAVDLRLDGFAALMVVIISGVGLLVLAYTATYQSPGDEGTGRLAGLLTLFAGAMVGLVLADHLLLLYACWELTSITSYLLIGHHHGDARARAAALQALLVTGAGGLAMLVGFVILGQAAGDLPARRGAGGDGRRGRPSRWAWCSCWSGRPPSRPSTRSTPGCPAPWWRRRR